MGNEIVSDGTVTKKVIVESMQRLRGPGRAEIAVDLAERELELMIHIANRCALLKEDMTVMGLTKTQADSLTRRIGTFMLEAVTAMETSKRALWNDMLPQMGDGDGVQGE